MAVVVTFHRGEDVLLTITMVPPVNISGWTIAFCMRAVLDELPVLIEKNGLPDIIIVDAGAGVFTVTIHSEETAAADLGTYFFDIQRIDPGSRAVLVEGTVDLIDMVNPVLV